MFKKYVHRRTRLDEWKRKEPDWKLIPNSIMIRDNMPPGWKRIPLSFKVNGESGSSNYTWEATWMEIPID